MASANRVPARGLGDMTSLSQALPQVRVPTVLT
jgi:hypothetical protein